MQNNTLFAFYINVDDHTERYRNMNIHIKYLNSLPCNNILIDRIDAITPDNLPQIIKKENVCIFPSDLEYACMASHLKTYKTIIDFQHNLPHSHFLPHGQWLLVLEDDAEFLETDFSEINKILDSRPKDAEVIQLFCRNPNIYPKLIREYNKNTLFTPYDSNHWGTSAYFISREGALKNLEIYFENDILNTLPTPFPTNVEAIVFHQLKAYTYTGPSPIITRENIPSTLGHDSHVTDHTYSNFMNRELRRYNGEGHNFVFILGANSFSCGMDSIVQTMNKDAYQRIDFELFPYLPWIYDENSILEKIKMLKSNKYPVVGDAGSYYISYVEKLIELLGEHAKFICLIDNRSECIEKFMNTTIGKNHWINPIDFSEYLEGQRSCPKKEKFGNLGIELIPDIYYDKCYPKYPIDDLENIYKNNPNIDLKKYLIGKYYDEYYDRAHYLADLHPQFKIFTKDTAVNRPEIIYRFLGTPKRIFR